ncbi:MAG: 8-amino-7-oxononanoate synthase [Pseudomonadota bacterium]
MGVFGDRLSAGLARRQRDGLYRQRLILRSAQGPTVALNDRRYLNFCSNDYLGLAAHPRVVEALRRAASDYGVGSGASHLVCGHSEPHHALEEALAELTGRSRALLYSSGYMANTGVLTTLLQSGDCVFQDKLNHASLLDGGLASGARFRRFPHNDVAALSRRLDAAPGPSLVAVDGVFSMDGDSAPLGELARECAGRGAWLMVDDAHGFGMRGSTGAGSLEEEGLSQADVPILMATLGKALGTAGAFVAGNEDLIDALIQQSRNYVYTTALPPALSAATLESVKLLREENWRRDHLRALVRRFRVGAEALSLPLLASDSAIQPLLVGDPLRALDLSERLREHGLLIGAIRPPTVPSGTARLRVTLSAAHSEAEVDRLLSVLGDCWSHG